jgi:hypothetical protein
VTDPFTIAVATAIATKSAESLGGQVGPAFAALVAKVKAKFRGKPEEQVLAAAEQHPESDDHLRALAAALSLAAADDPAFGAELRELRSLAQQRVEVSGGVANIIQGHADKVVQMKDVHGGLTIN